ncbi:hypothetical protein LO762_15495 [Actinocorallia sp. API 0066]|uniref:hypothetical protein n=1 Tax=Actinocorallia sp. API 0066 TaxID=2896846 RepID=UPI001E56B9C7|nr:hypothetical protein [Actinocorallia sp. API 0066]MCD0450584.1 hypothetical protein [Actinocorallia sp. API 0066]
MNHDEMVQRGRLPWAPRAGSGDLEVWQEYEVPQVGTFRLGGQVVLFTSIDVASARTTVWAYRVLSPAEADAAADVTFGSAEELKDYVDALFRHQKAVLALASDLLIDKWAPVDVGDDLLKTAVGFLGDLLKATATPREAFRGAVAAVETVHSDFAEA